MTVPGSSFLHSPLLPVFLKLSIKKKKKLLCKMWIVLDQRSFVKTKSDLHICLGLKKMPKLSHDSTNWLGHKLHLLRCLVTWCPTPLVSYCWKAMTGDQTFYLHATSSLFSLWYLSTEEVSDWKLEIMHHHIHSCHSSISCTAGSVGYLSAVNRSLSGTHTDRIPNYQLLHYPIHMT